MAPALTEPLNSKEKLSSSAATASPTTRGSKKFEPTTSTSAAVTTSTPAASVTEKDTPVSPSSNSPREKKSVSSPTTTTTRTTATTSTRVTRSKDNSKDKTVVAAAANNKTPPITTRRNNKLSDDQMGLSAARNNNSQSTKTTTTNSCNDNNNKDLDIVTTETKATVVVNKETLAEKLVAVEEPSGKDNSTEQLLADLTYDFEEAKLAEICLFNKLPEVTLNKEVVVAAVEATVTKNNNTTTTTTAPTAEQTSVSVSVAEVERALQHMESELETATETVTTKDDTTAVAEDVIATTEQTKQEQEKIEICSNNKDTEPVNAAQRSEQPACSRANIISLEELPSISTDSTMSASEVDDNLEERLSQLDGNSLPTTLTLAPPPANVQAPLEQEQSTSENIVTSQEQAQKTVISPSMQPVAATPIQTEQQQLQPATQGFLKENTSNTGAGGGGGDELGEQDIEEVLKALKSFDGASNTDTLVDFFNDVLQTVNTYPNFEQEINNQAASTSLTKLATPTKECLDEIEKKQEQLTGKIDVLLRRMRRLQARHMCRHTSTEIAGLFEWSARASTKASNPVRSTPMSEQEAAVISVVSGRVPPDFWQEQKRSPLPSAQMSTMLRQLETAAHEQQLATATLNNNSSSNTIYGLALQTRRPKKQQQQQQQENQNAAAAATVATTQPKSDEVVPDYDIYVTGELSHVSGLLHTEMREVQNAIDSDATESSSGGESADEMVTYNNQAQLPLTISKRAVWRYSRDRAAIALRWSWLMTQVADLDVKIRQHNDLDNEINRSKGEIVLESPTKSQDTSNTTNSINGYKNINYDSESELEESCCRTRALVLHQFRKRKLLQTTNMHTISKKAARPSNIKCGCEWPQLPCALCTGRADPTAPRALPDTMMPPNRVALLDAGFHPVLSFPEDTCQSIHLESICRQPDWQHRVMRGQAKTISKGVWKAEREAAALAGARRHGETKRRYVRRKERGGAAGYNNTESGSNKLAATSSSAKNGVVNTFDTGNGTTSTPTTTPTTPLVANTSGKRQRRPRNNKKNLINNQMNMQENSLTKIDQYNNHDNNSQQSTLISSSSYNNKNRKCSSITNSNNINSLNQYNTSSQFDASATTSVNSFLNNSSSDHWDAAAAAAQRSRTSSPTPGSKSGHTKNERSSRTRISYDIDNIVIPYSIAATTRVEILPYKEIPTPTWRVIVNGNECDKEQNTPTNIDKESGGTVEEDSAAPNPQLTETNKAKETIVVKNSEIVKPKPPPDIKTKANGVLTQINGTTQKKETVKTDNDMAVTTQEEDVLKTNNDKESKLKEIVKNITPKDASKTLQNPTEKVATNPAVKIVNGNAANKVAVANKKLAEEEKSLKNDVINNKTNLKHRTNTKNNNNILKTKNINANKKNNAVQKSFVAADNDDVVNSVKQTTAAAATIVDAATTLVDTKNDDTKEIMSAPKKNNDDDDDAPAAKKRKLENGTMESNNRNGDGNGNVVVGSDGTGKKVIVKKHAVMKMPPIPPTAAVSVAVAKDALASGSCKTGVNDVVVAPNDCVVEDVEDVSDEAFLGRHQRALIDERRKFITYLKYPFSTRSRANRRIDSRAESSGANTPDPSSPAPHSATIGGGGLDNESIPSPLAIQHCNNPLDAFNDMPESIYAISTKLNNKRQERRRTTSLKNRELERRSPSPEFVPPYEPLQFPLSDEQYAQILREAEVASKRKHVFKFIELNNATTSSASSGSGAAKRAATATKTILHNSDVGGVSGGRRNNSNRYNNSTNRKSNADDLQRPNGRIQQHTHTDADGDYLEAKNDAGDDDDDLVDDEDSLLPEDIINAIDDDDDDFPKHHLAPPPSEDQINTYYDESAAAYIGHGPQAGDSEIDDMEDPFADDDPNDPEWKRGLGARSEQRLRRKL